MPSTNQRVGEYVLSRRIGGGAFGEVWLAFHHAWSKEQAAVKIPSDPQYLRNLQQEGLAIRDLSHANIVRAINFDPWADVPYLVMDYVPGTTLRSLIAKGPLPVDDALAVMRQVLAALVHAHERGLIHRDVKPENILIHERWTTAGLAADGVVKLTDFGLGNAPAQAAQSILMSIETSHSSKLAGTQYYIPPEQFDGGVAPDPRTDVYACGIVLFEMLTGVRPVGAELPSDVTASVPRYLDDVYRRAVARRAQRYASAEEMTAALAPPASVNPAKEESPAPSNGATAPMPAPVLPPPLPTRPSAVPPPLPAAGTRTSAFTNTIGMKFVRIEPVGSPPYEDGRSDGETQHRVRLSKPFAMGATTVTQAQWKAVMGTSPSHFKGDSLPVEQVSWNDAVEFCRKLSKKEGKKYRLPTEAEWEYACRAGTSDRFYIGNADADLGDAAWYSANSGSTTHPVGQKKPNAWGLYDMHGNVWEWCNDAYATYPPGDASDPIGPQVSAKGASRVLRGGSWYLVPRDCRSASRVGNSPDARSTSYGFRVVLDSP